MGWIVDALANVILEALNDCMSFFEDLVANFSLNIGTGNSVFETSLSGFSSFKWAIGILAMTIVLLTCALKIYQGMAGPFVQAEEPGSVAMRTIFAGVGVILSYELFVIIEKIFNEVYKLFRNNYNDMINKVSGLNYDSAIASNSGQGVAADSGNVTATQAYNLFGEHLIKGGSGSLGVLLIEVFFGVAIVIAFVKLILECYERYVIIGVLYFTCPLAFSSIVSRSSTVFKNWCSMLVSQFILMCSNLIFLGIFISTWKGKILRGVGDGYIFNSQTEFFVFMFLVLAWLITGQKADELLRSLGLSAAQTGAGLFGAAAGTMALVRAGVGMASSIAKGGYNAATGQTGIQKAVMNSSKGGGGLVGRVSRGVTGIANARNSDRMPSQDEARSMVGGKKTITGATAYKAGIAALGGGDAAKKAIEGYEGSNGSKINFGNLDLDKSSIGGGAMTFQDRDGNKISFRETGGIKSSSESQNISPIGDGYYSATSPKVVRSDGGASPSIKVDVGNLNDRLGRQGSSTVINNYTQTSESVASEKKQKRGITNNKKKK